MSLMAANEESDPSAILNGFWVTLFFYPQPSNIAQLHDSIIAAHVYCFRLVIRTVHHHNHTAVNKQH